GSDRDGPAGRIGRRRRRTGTPVGCRTLGRRAIPGRLGSETWPTGTRRAPRGTRRHHPGPRHASRRTRSSSMVGSRCGGSPRGRCVPVRPHPMTVALVTGGHGFVGSHLGRLLVGEGWSVISLGRSEAEAAHGERYVRADVTIPNEIN